MGGFGGGSIFTFLAMIVLLASLVPFAVISLLARFVFPESADSGRARYLVWYIAAVMIAVLFLFPYVTFMFGANSGAGVAAALAVTFPVLWGLVYPKAKGFLGAGAIFFTGLACAGAWLLVLAIF